MEGDVARRFHAATELDPGRPATGGPFDPRIEPAKVKRYPDLDGLPLPEDWSEPQTDVAAVLSGAEGDPGRGPDPGVARLLFLSHGVSRTLWGRRFRTAPSAGALYPIELYVVCAELAGLHAGVYHHDPERRTLTAIREGDHRGSLAHACADPSVATRPVSFVLTGIPWRTTWKYGPRGYRHLFWDAGVILANTLAAAAAAGSPARVAIAFVDSDVSRLLDLGGHLPFDEWPLVVVTIGRDWPDPAVREDRGNRPRHDVAELSPERATWPEIAEVHRAGDLDDTAAVDAWRDRVAGLSLAPATDPAPPPAVDGDTIDQVILRRGSTRRFDPDRTVPESALRWGLPVALRAIDGDLAPDGRTPLSAHVAVHAVEGIEPGGYRWVADGPDPVVGSQTREATAHLCLDQALGGAAAFTAFLGADLDRILDVLGARGYRTAQLAAGVAAGRLQLAAFALGLGGSGLTFYDDEVRRHFGTAHDPLLVAAVGVPDYEPRPGSRPGA